MNPIVVAFGTHEHADAALRWGAGAARLTGAPLHVVNVFEPSYAEVAPEHLEELVAHRHNNVERVLDEVGFAGAESSVVFGSEPIVTIAEFLREHAASMVVIGAHGSGQPGGLSSGHTGHYMLHHSPVPVVVVRPGFPPLEHGHVVVGVDGSTANSVAVDQAQQLCTASHGDIHAVFAYDPMDDTFGHPDGWHRHSDEVRREVSKVTDAEIKLFMAAGHPAHVLLEHAQRENAAAIIVGTRGRGGFLGLRIGRVPTQLVDHATCPVIVVPHDSGNEH